MNRTAPLGGKARWCLIATAGRPKRWSTTPTSGPRPWPTKCSAPTPWCWPWTPPPLREELDAAFGEFDGYLRRMERRRGDRTDVGGLPVFLVLTKCDRLARPGEITADWLEHIEDRKARGRRPLPRFSGRPRRTRTSSRRSAASTCTFGRRPCAARPGRRRR